MPSVLNESDKSIIKNMMLRKSVKDISHLIECDERIVSDFISVAIKDTGVVTWQMKLDSKKLQKPMAPTKLKKFTIARKQQIDREREQKEKNRLKMEALKQAREREAEQKYKRRPPAYKTIVVDYTQLRTVRIDRTTTIYAKPGEEEETKREFLKRYKKPIDNYPLISK